MMSYWACTRPASDPMGEQTLRRGTVPTIALLTHEVFGQALRLGRSNGAAGGSGPEAVRGHPLVLLGGVVVDVGQGDALDALDPVEREY